MSWCQVEFGARKPGMLNSAVLRERAPCEQSIFISQKGQIKQWVCTASSIWFLHWHTKTSRIHREQTCLANFSNIIRKNVQTWSRLILYDLWHVNMFLIKCVKHVLDTLHTSSSSSSLKWFVRFVHTIWNSSRSSAAGKGFFWIPSPGRRHTGAARKPRRTCFVCSTVKISVKTLGSFHLALRPRLPRGCGDCEDGAKLSDGMADGNMTKWE